MTDELDAYLTESLWDDDGNLVRDATDTLIADKMLYALRMLSTERRRIVGQAQTRIDQVTEWRDGRCDIIDRRTADLERAIEGYARAMHNLNPRQVTWKRTDGHYALIKARSRVEFDEPDETVRWALMSGRFELLASIKPSKTAFSKLTIKEADDQTDPDQMVFMVVADDGEIVPGVKVVLPTRRTFSISPAP